MITNYSIDKTLSEPAYLQLYRQIRESITKGAILCGEKLPSKRLLAEELAISVITVDHAMSLLADEGYIEARQRSGYYCVYSEPDKTAKAQAAPALKAVKTVLPPPDTERKSIDFSVSNTASYRESTDADFPFSVLAKTMRRVISEYDSAILVKSPNTGTERLRRAIASYLARNRGISVSESNIIIGAGAEYLYGLLVNILGRDLKYATEDPSYEKITQVYSANGVKTVPLALGHDGIVSSELEKDFDILHISPYRSYPSGVTASASKRKEYIRWADSAPQRYIIEDDFESEFTPSTKPEDTVFSLAQNDNVIYLNTFSKTIAPSIRAGYMILPERLISAYSEKAGFYSCAVPTFEQYVLAEFIENGDFERHISRVRRKNRKNKAESGQNSDRYAHRKV